VTGADRDVLLRLPVALDERPVVVRAPVLERVQLPVDVEDADGDHPRVDELHRPGREVVDRADQDVQD
jgi:hypothetical protein